MVFRHPDPPVSSLAGLRTDAIPGVVHSSARFWGLVLNLEEVSSVERQNSFWWLVAPERVLLIPLRVPGVGRAVVEDRADDAAVQQQAEVAAVDRLPPPLVLDRPDVLDLHDRQAANPFDERDRHPVLDNDPQRAWLIQG